jgi:hypothetical protein
VSAFGALAAESLRDAARRRVVTAVAVLSLGSLFMVESCTSCTATQIGLEGEPGRVLDLAGATGTVTFAMLGMWCVVLAGLLAADHLAQSLADGTATLCLARPVGRARFAGARLAGVLAIAWGAALLLLGATAFFLRQRSDLALAPALASGAAAAAGCVVVGGLAMTASLAFPRFATLLLVFPAVGVVALANLASLVRGGQLEPGVLAAVDRFGPPLLTALVVPLGPWLESVSLPAAPGVALRLAAWALGSVALLAFAFRRVELDGADAR